MNSLLKRPPDLPEFSGKCVLVTGGTKGAGKAIAARFKQGGATVIITARSVPEENDDSHFIQANVSTPAGTTKVITEIFSGALTSSSTMSGDHLRPAAASPPSLMNSGSRQSTRTCFPPFVSTAAYCRA
jgi:hypothetical protein